MHFGNFSIFKGISEILEVLGYIYSSIIRQFSGVELGWLRLYVMLILISVTMEQSNVSKK